ncbi:hypothetical protein [Deinococcus sp. QL22]|uniref:hypothetical protein n=1 Tax=Deinococcus sp. QL22 TaxID=2939437 RepID=UPI002017519C|nr:hypothetical protein [Deinococcus sp. QL22]UQN06552.1 hypothetical protein M1R55_01120 [Deinococcus sp. QL22]
MNDRMFGVIAQVRGPRGARLAERLLAGGASLRLVNRVVMDDVGWSLGGDEDASLVDETARLLNVPLPAWSPDERLGLLAVYIVEGRGAFEHVLETLRAVPPGMVRRALTWRAVFEWTTFEAARGAVPAALDLMAQRRRSTVEALMDLGEDNLLSTLREVLAAPP